ncbi:hypothetical protein CGT72_08210 [Vibrio cholerae]|nr:hypothetical protein [Vibrio cholerae]EGR2062481.1 hypothetical protein [Vibrio cholerae]EGR2113102.1 hypothetical protein [Vibrio cholerae]EGR2242142.1 hypothetical protein [Vibrio cholerae]PAS33816.1 hypothetical protein CGT72_08210 [Vibrio cholerae]
MHINLTTGQYIAQKQHLSARQARSYLKGKIVIETSGKYKTIHFCVSSSFKVNIKVNKVNSIISLSPN